MEALPTFFMDIEFRSRTEARWAVFFDAMEFKWEYENQGYKLNNGELYLPDFELTLPAGKEYYIEVKPDNFDKFENMDYINKLREFIASAQKELIILNGNPRCKPYDVLSPKIKEGGQLGFFQDYDPFFKICDSYWFSCTKCDPNTGSREWVDKMDERAIYKDFGKQYLNALKTAKQEKFGI